MVPDGILAKDYICDETLNKGNENETSRDFILMIFLKMLAFSIRIGGIKTRFVKLPKAERFSVVRSDNMLIKWLTFCHH